MGKSVMILAASVLFVLQAEAAQLGYVEIAGSACQASVGTHELTEVGQNRYLIPNSIYVKKEEDKKVARGACTFAVTLQAAAGKKIIVANSHQLTSLRAYPSQTKARVDLELFKAGEQGERQVVETESTDRTSRISKSLQQAAILETECGGSAILRGNLAATLIGTGKARAYTRSLYLDIVEVDCN
ncbi:hypothetical protein [Bdellovibrio reynosensis]|uniref:Uncharacterized protein n=1 Tax=Bdellovibrio reynosensis TaxID=2835041 RepID=A0ABY4C9C0_9BACT|nr:hypothetical protein [Bdellovibrio reynosensis]UOF00088.1 hypothetical protein MNR06_10280 [Bdellovibrio reynosensis]